MSEQLLQNSIAQLQALQSKPKSKFRRQKVLTISKEPNSFLSVIQDNDIILNSNKRAEVATQTPSYRNFNALLLDRPLQLANDLPDHSALLTKLAKLQQMLQLKEKQLEYFRAKVKPEAGQFSLKEIQNNEAVREIDWLRTREASLMKQLLVQKSHIQTLEKTIKESSQILQQKIKERERLFWRTVQHEKHEVTAELHRLRQRQRQKLGKQALNLEGILKTLDSLLQTN